MSVQAIHVKIMENAAMQSMATIANVLQASLEIIVRKVSRQLSK